MSRLNRWMGLGILATAISGCSGGGVEEGMPSTPKLMQPPTDMTAKMLEHSKQKPQKARAGLVPPPLGPTRGRR
ncbi:hypothetical protein [Singulisphaera sp. PoT]|uniref:hypothetical protein n=1 Tax=Singulisphaera sp. PoT TaxID=3411797 RepID=UPI003BF5B490